MALSTLSSSLSHVVGIGDCLEASQTLLLQVTEANQKLRVPAGGRGGEEEEGGKRKREGKWGREEENGEREEEKKESSESGGVG